MYVRFSFFRGKKNQLSSCKMLKLSLFRLYFLFPKEIKPKRGENGLSHECFLFARNFLIRTPAAKSDLFWLISSTRSALFSIKNCCIITNFNKLSSCLFRREHEITIVCIWLCMPFNRKSSSRRSFVVNEETPLMGDRTSVIDDDAYLIPTASPRSFTSLSSTSSYCSSMFRLVDSFGRFPLLFPWWLNIADRERIY